MEHRKKRGSNVPSATTLPSGSCNGNDDDKYYASTTKKIHSHWRWHKYYGPTVAVWYHWLGTFGGSRISRRKGHGGTATTTTTATTNASNPVGTILFRIFAIASTFCAVIFLVNGFMDLVRNGGGSDTGSSGGGVPLTASNNVHRVLHQRIGTDPLTLQQGAVPSHYLVSKPRVVGVYFDDPITTSQRRHHKTKHHHHHHHEEYRPQDLVQQRVVGTERLDPNLIRLYRTNTRIDVPRKALEKQEELQNSKEYKHGRADQFENKRCKRQYEWQMLSYPTCNFLMEQDLTHLQLMKDGHSPVRLLANGFWRDVWKIVNEYQDERVVLKTIRYEHDYIPRNYDRHRRDAVAMERLSSSPYIVNIFGFCGNSGLFEFADGGDLDTIYDSQDEPIEPKMKLIIAHQLASGLAAVHNFAKEGVPAIAHTDITPGQFVYITEEGTYKLNDFNRCRFIRWNDKENTTCPFHVGNNPGTFRSPEEYRYEPETAQIDVYSLGNIFYGLLTATWPMEHYDESEDARKAIKKGKRPHIESKIYNSTEPFTHALVQATRACWTEDPTNRATSRQIEQYLSDALEKLDVKPDGIVEE